MSGTCTLYNMHSAQSQRSCRYVFDFTSLRVFSNLRSFFLFFRQTLTFIWLLCSDITRMTLDVLIEQLLTMRTEVYSANTTSVTKHVFGFLEVS